MSDLTVVLTSCRRPDLLIGTLDSFFSTNDYPLREFIIIEDSDDRSVWAIPARYPEQPIRVILNGVNISSTALSTGHIRKCKPLTSCISKTTGHFLFLRLWAGHRNTEAGPASGARSTQNR